MVGRPFMAPGVDEVGGAKREFQTAVRVADLQHGAGNAFRLRGQQLEVALTGLRHRQYGDRPVFDLCFDAHAFALFAVVEGQTAQQGPPFGNVDMERAVMAGEDEPFAEVHRRDLRIAAAGAERIDDLHHLAVLQIALAAAWQPARRQQRAAQGESRRDPFIFIAIQPAIVVGKAVQI